MASSLALNRTTALLFNRLLSPLRSASIAPSVTRSLNTNAQMQRYDDEDDRNGDVDRRSDRYVSRRRDFSPSFFADVFDPLSPTRSLSQVLHLLEQLSESPLTATSRGIGASGTRRGWDVKEDKDGVHIRVDMPGLDKENLKICVEQNTLVIKGEGEKECDGDEIGRRYSGRLDLPMELFKLNEIKAEMKNGVLKVNVPKVKEEERKDVFQVKVD